MKRPLEWSFVGCKTIAAFSLEARIPTARFIKVEIGHLVGQFVSHDCFFPPIKGPRDRRGFLKSAFVPARWQFHPISRNKKKKKKEKRETPPRDDTFNSRCNTARFNAVFRGHFYNREHLFLRQLRILYLVASSRFFLASDRLERATILNRNPSKNLNSAKI